MNILVATTSLHKDRGIAELLADARLTLETLNDYAATEAQEEDGDPMTAKARTKAQYYAQHFCCTVLADDSGLEVDALNGEPGVHSGWADGSHATGCAPCSTAYKTSRTTSAAPVTAALCLATPDEILLEN
ncbi:MAG: hypothetical protein EOP04_07295 [Proteobacteria bacterium]|nr:MAG: hypothetical protein EOP04_07295 [Pseudomonadota bacterium]